MTHSWSSHPPRAQGEEMAAAKLAQVSDCLRADGVRGRGAVLESACFLTVPKGSEIHSYCACG